MDEKGARLLKERDIEEIFSVRTYMGARKGERERIQSATKGHIISPCLLSTHHVLTLHTFQLFSLLPFIFAPSHNV